MKKNELRSIWIGILNVLLLYFFVWKNFVALQSYQEQESKYREEGKRIEQEVAERQQQKRALEERKEKKEEQEQELKKEAFSHPLDLENYLWQKLEKYELSIQSISRIQWEETEEDFLVLLPVEIIGKQEKLILFLKDVEDSEKYIRFSGQYLKWERKALGRALLRASLRTYIQEKGDFQLEVRENKKKNYVRRRRGNEEKAEEKL